MEAISAKSFLDDKSLFDEAERPHTLGLRRSQGHQNEITGCPDTLDGFDPEGKGCSEDFMPEWGVGRWPMDIGTPGIYWHYGLCQYIECATPNCDGGILRASSRGAMGTFPWIDPGNLSGNVPHWVVIVRFQPLSGRSVLDME